MLHVLNIDHQALSTQCSVQLVPSLYLETSEVISLCQLFIFYLSACRRDDVASPSLLTPIPNIDLLGISNQGAAFFAIEIK